MFNTNASSKIVACNDRMIAEQCVRKDVEGSGRDVNWCKSYYLVEARKVTGKSEVGYATSE